MRQKIYGTIDSVEPIWIDEVKDLIRCQLQFELVRQELVTAGTTPKYVPNIIGSIVDRFHYHRNQPDMIACFEANMQGLTPENLEEKVATIYTALSKCGVAGRRTVLGYRSYSS